METPGANPVDSFFSLAFSDMALFDLCSAWFVCDLLVWEMWLVEAKEGAGVVKPLVWEHEMNDMASAMRSLAVACRRIMVAWVRLCFCLCAVCSLCVVCWEVVELVELT